VSDVGGPMSRPFDAPSPWVARFAPLIRRAGPVLDLACGGGRHTRLFLGRGHPVTAVDLDVRGLADLAGAAGVTVLAVDLEGGSQPLVGPLSGPFAGIIVTNYLHRPLFPGLIAALEPGGVLLYETFAVGNERFGRPSSPSFLLREGELLEIARPALRIVAFEQGVVASPKAAVVQRLCAVRRQPAGAVDGDSPDEILSLPAP
jgi:SAM-dependent methyltransferase